MYDPSGEAIRSLANYLVPFVDRSHIESGLDEAVYDDEASGTWTLLWAAADAKVIVPETILQKIELHVLPLADHADLPDIIQKYLSELRELRTELIGPDLKSEREIANWPEPCIEVARALAEFLTPFADSQEIKTALATAEHKDCTIGTEQLLRLANETKAVPPATILNGIRLHVLPKATNESVINEIKRQLEELKQLGNEKIKRASAELSASGWRGVTYVGADYTVKPLGTAQDLRELTSLVR